VAAQELYERGRPVANVEKVKTVTPRPAHFEGSSPARSSVRSLGMRAGLEAASPVQTASGGTFQLGTDAMMIFAEKLQCEPVLEFPQSHGGAPLGRIAGPILGARKCRSAQDVYGPHSSSRPRAPCQCTIFCWIIPKDMPEGTGETAAARIPDGVRNLFDRKNICSQQITSLAHAQLAQCCHRRASDGISKASHECRST
jgi:hypothetical protein